MSTRTLLRSLLQALAGRPTKNVPYWTNRYGLRCNRSKIRQRMAVGKIMYTRNMVEPPQKLNMILANCHSSSHFFHATLFPFSSDSLSSSTTPHLRHVITTNKRRVRVTDLRTDGNTADTFTRAQRKDIPHLLHAGTTVLVDRILPRALGQFDRGRKTRWNNDELQTLCRMVAGVLLGILHGVEPDAALYILARFV